MCFRVLELFCIVVGFLVLGYGIVNECFWFREFGVFMWLVLLRDRVGDSYWEI